MKLNLTSNTSLIHISSNFNRISDFSLLSSDDNECRERFDGKNCSWSYDRLFDLSVSVICSLLIDWNIEGVSGGVSSVIEGGGEGDTGVTCNGVKFCNKGCLIGSDIGGSISDWCCCSEVAKEKMKNIVKDIHTYHK